VIIAGGSLDEASGSNIAVLFDISQRKRADRQRQEAQARLAAVLESLPLAVAVADSSGDPVAVNAMAETVWGAKPMISLPEYHQFKDWSPVTGNKYNTSDWPLVRALNGEVIRGEIVNIETFDGKAKTVSGLMR
jgi:PAS domain-containing protein